MSIKQMESESQQVKFVLPDRREFEGTIKRIDINQFELAIDDLPEEPWEVLEHLEAQAKKSDDKYHFLNVRYIGSSSHMGRSNASKTTYFSPTTTLYTNDPDNSLSQNISSLSTNVENLDIWLNQSLFSFHNPMHMVDTMDYSLQKEIGEYNFKDFKLTFDLAIGGMKYSRFTREVKLKQVGHLELSTGENNQPYTNFVEALRSIERFLGLAYLSPVLSADVDVVSRDYGLIIGGGEVPNVFPAYEIIMSDIKAATPSVSYSDELAFTHDQVEDFQALLNTWISLEEKLLPIVDLYLSTVAGGNTVIENILLNRIQGIEAFHRSFRSGSSLGVEEYEEQKKRILDKFTGSDRKFLKGILKRGNDLSLEQRMRKLDEELKLKGIPTVMVCDFDVVANTRNYYSHYSDDITNICPPENLSELTHQAGQMLFALVLSELGLSKEIVGNAVRRMGKL